MVFLPSLALFILPRTGAGVVTVPSLPLGNAADPGMRIPAIGLGTGGYGHKPLAPGEKGPECWDDGYPDSSGAILGPNCSEIALGAPLAWLAAGGRRIDSADTYENMIATGQAMARSGVAREDIWLTGKVGSPLPMGFYDTLFQVEFMLNAYNTSYIDIVHVHWPTSPGKSDDPLCKEAGTACRLSTYKALLKLWKDKKIRAVGVSNYDVEYLQEIVDAGLELPAVNQNPFNPHLYTAQVKNMAFCKAKGIVFNSYSPLGVPDTHKFPNGTSKEGSLLEEPAIKKIAQAHSINTAQVLLAWQWHRGVIMNPRSANVTHMQEALDGVIFNTKLSSAEIIVLDSFKPDRCSDDPSWYECCGGTTVIGSMPTCGEADDVLIV